ncbi:MAG: hypothetical protein ABI477_05650 [Chryseolinea sp.]
MSKMTDINNLSKDELMIEVIQLKHQVSLLHRMVFGPKSDRFKLAVEVVSGESYQ